MELMDPLINSSNAQNSYDLFNVIMQAPVLLAYPEEKKWKAACLAMHGAYQWDDGLPQIVDPQNILTFLHHHFGSIIRGHKDHEPIQNALHALVNAPRLIAIESVHFNLTQHSFVCGICHVFQDDQPLKLRTTALFFLPHLGDRWFNTTHPIMAPTYMAKLCIGWASTIDNVEHTNDILKAALTAFLGMINSHHWRPHVVPEKWKLLESFTLLPDDSQPLRRCINNPELMDVIREMGNPVTMALWFTVLWYKYKELVPCVQEQLGAVAEQVARGGGVDLNMCLSVIDSELERAKGTLDQLAEYNRAFSTPACSSPVPTHLEERVRKLQQASASLAALKRG